MIGTIRVAPYGLQAGRPKLTKAGNSCMNASFFYVLTQFIQVHPSTFKSELCNLRATRVSPLILLPWHQ